MVVLGEKGKRGGHATRRKRICVVFVRGKEKDAGWGEGCATGEGFSRENTRRRHTEFRRRLVFVKLWDEARRQTNKRSVNTLRRTGPTVVEDFWGRPLTGGNALVHRNNFQSFLFPPFLSFNFFFFLKSVEKNSRFISVVTLAERIRFRGRIEGEKGGAVVEICRRKVDFPRTTSSDIRRISIIACRQTAVEEEEEEASFLQRGSSKPIKYSYCFLTSAKTPIRLVFITFENGQEIIQSFNSSIFFEELRVCYIVCIHKLKGICLRRLH